MLNKIEKVYKSLNFEQPKCIKKVCVLNINILFNFMVQIFAKYI